MVRMKGRHWQHPSWILTSFLVALVQLQQCSGQRLNPAFSPGDAASMFLPAGLMPPRSALVLRDFPISSGVLKRTPTVVEAKKFLDIMRNASLRARERLAALRRQVMADKVRRIQGMAPNIHPQDPFLRFEEEVPRIFMTRPPVPSTTTQPETTTTTTPPSTEPPQTTLPVTVQQLEQITVGVGAALPEVGPIPAPTPIDPHPVEPRPVGPVPASFGDESTVYGARRPVGSRQNLRGERKFGRGRNKTLKRLGYQQQHQHRMGRLNGRLQGRLMARLQH